LGGFYFEFPRGPIRLISFHSCSSFSSLSFFPGQLALRAGNEKEEGETADTVGCCSLRVEHISLHPELDGQEYVVEFDFLGKDSIRYYNKVPVEKRVS
jgi:DNA topoisomerase-1